MNHSGLISEIQRYKTMIGRRKKINLHSREIEDRTSGIPTVKSATP